MSVATIVLSVETTVLSVAAIVLSVATVNASVVASIVASVVASYWTAQSPAPSCITIPVASSWTCLQVQHGS